MLRPYQEKLIADTVEAARLHKRILIQAPTGCGKSVIFSDLIRRAVDKGRDVLFLVHRRELVYQADNHLRSLGIQAGICMSGEEFFSSQVTLASVQTIHRRLNRMDMKRYALVIVDESHHVGSKSYVEILKHCVNGGRVVGFTATPIRKGGKSLGSMFDVMVRGPRIEDLQADGYLCNIEYMSLRAPDLRGVKVSNGDYSEKYLQEKVAPQLMGGVVDHYLKYGGKRGIIFTCGQMHSYHLRDEFVRKGRKALVIDSQTKDDDRRKLESEFREGEEGILLNCGIFTEGYDLPDCDTLVLARPTKSLGLYLQMAGRGLRPKSNGGALLCIDHGANVYRHGFVEDEHYWNLEPSNEAEVRLGEQRMDRVKKYAACVECGTMVIGRKCKKCGHEITRLEIARNVRELRNCRLKLVDRSDVKKPKPAACTAAAWNNILGYVAMKGGLLGRAAHQFKYRFGILPWQAKLGVHLPVKDEWRMLAADWVEKNKKEKLSI